MPLFRRLFERSIGAFARLLENFADGIRDLAAAPEQGETPKQSRTRRRAERRARRRDRAEVDRRARMGPTERVVQEVRDWIAETREAPGAAPPAPSVTEAPGLGLPGVEQPELLRGNGEAVAEQFERHFFIDFEGAARAYDSLLEAGVSAMWMAIYYVPGRGYGLFVMPS